MQRFSEIFDEGFYDGIDTLFRIPHLKKEKKGRRQEKEETNGSKRSEKERNTM